MKKGFRMSIFSLLFTCLFLPVENLFSQDSTSISSQDLVIMNDSIRLNANLVMPAGIKKPPVVLIIAGSGPTDMNGNNPVMTNNSLKFLAEDLGHKGIASLRYDKRVIPENQNKFTEQDLVFDDFVSDAQKCMEYLEKDGRFGKFYILGHSQGSLIGMLVAEKVKVNGFISLAGAGEPIGAILVNQISAQSPSLGQETAIIVDSLKAGFEVKHINPYLQSVFRPSVQPFIRSWLKYDPAIEISKLKTKVLIIQGTTDIQVSKQEAQNLKAGDPKAKLVFIDGMNHILKKAPEDRIENIKTYSNADLPVMPELIKAITDFIGH